MLFLYRKKWQKDIKIGKIAILKKDDFFAKKVLTNGESFSKISKYSARADTREWRNWQTRTFEGRVVHTVRVQVPSLAPQKGSP